MVDLLVGKFETYTTLNAAGAAAGANDRILVRDDQAYSSDSWTTALTNVTIEAHPDNTSDVLFDGDGLTTNWLSHTGAGAFSVKGNASGFGFIVEKYTGYAIQGQAGGAGYTFVEELTHLTIRNNLGSIRRVRGASAADRARMRHVVARVNEQPLQLTGYFDVALCEIDGGGQTSGSEVLDLGISTRLAHSGVGHVKATYNGVKADGDAGVELLDVWIAGQGATAVVNHADAYICGLGIVTETGGSWTTELTNAFPGGRVISTTEAAAAFVDYDGFDWRITAISSLAGKGAPVVAGPDATTNNSLAVTHDRDGDEYGDAAYATKFLRHDGDQAQLVNDPAIGNTLLSDTVADSNGFTVGIWARTDSTINEGSFLGSAFNSGTFRWGVTFGLSGNLYWSHSAGFTRQGVETSRDWRSGYFAHHCVTYNRSTNQVTWYVNGEQVGQITGGGSDPDSGDDVVPVGGGGSGGGGWTDDWSWGGDTLHQVWIPRVLTPTEVAELAAGGAPFDASGLSFASADLDHWYKYGDGDTSPSALDSGNDASPTLTLQVVTDPDLPEYTTAADNALRRNVSIGPYAAESGATGPGDFTLPELTASGSTAELTSSTIPAPSALETGKLELVPNGGPMVSLGQLVLIALQCDRRAGPDDGLAPGEDPAGYWGDAFGPAGRELGSRLRWLARQPVTEELLVLREEAIREALAPLIEDGVMAEAIYEGEIVNRNLRESVTCVRSDGEETVLRYDGLWSVVT